MIWYSHRSSCIYPFPGFWGRFQKRKWEQIHYLAGYLKHILYLICSPSEIKTYEQKILRFFYSSEASPWTQDGFSFISSTSSKQRSWTVPTNRTFILLQVPQSHHSSIWMTVKFKCRRNNLNWQQIYLANNWAWVVTILIYSVNKNRKIKYKL